MRAEKLPDDAATGIDLDHPAVIGFNDKGVAIGQALSGPADPRIERLALCSTVFPQDVLGQGVELDDAGKVGADIVVKHHEGT